MSDDWPHGWYSDEPGRRGAGEQRAQPSFTPNSPGARGQRPPNPAGQDWNAPGDRAAWPAQPPPRSWTGGGGGAGGGGGYRPRGGRRWLRPRRILAILAGLVALNGVADGAGLLRQE